METESIPVLLLASESGEGQFLHLVSPQLKLELAASGYFLFESFAGQLEPGDLDAFAVVVLLRSPLPGHPKDDSDLFASFEPELVRFVERGGGLVLMFCECYGKTVEPLNRLAARFDMRFAFNQLSDSRPDHCAALPNMPEGRLIKAFAGPNAPFAPGSGALFLVVDGGHGTQSLTCLPSDDWTVLLRGSETCRSEPFPDGNYTAGTDEPIDAPVLASCRTFGRGRVCAFPESSAIWLANACLPRWEEFLLRQGDGEGFDFLVGMLRWAAGPVPIGNRATAMALPPRRIVSEQDFSYRYLTPTEAVERAALRPHKVWIGLPPTDVSVMDVAAAAAAAGYAAAVVLSDYDALSPERWQQVQAECRAASGIHHVALQAGLEMLDDEGNCCVVFNVEALPEMRHAYPNSNMLEDLLVKLSSYSSVYARPTHNRIPPWRHGGYNLIEIDADPAALSFYRERVASCSSLAPVTICRDVLPGAERVSTYTLASSPAAALDAICGNRRDSFVTQGPVLDTFRWEGRACMLDDWEGIWMEWNEGDELAVEIALHGEHPIDQVTLYDGDRVFREFHPGSERFETSVSFKAEKDMRLHLVAEDRSGKTLVATAPLYSRCRTFWAHVGSDQMNDYHNLWRETDRGGIGIGDRFYEAFGFVTLGFGWGDYLRMASTLPWSDVMPDGMEVSVLVCSFKSFHPSPFIGLSEGFDFLNNHHRVLGRCTSTCHTVHDFSDGSWLEQPGTDWKTPNGSRTFQPTRAITPSSRWEAKTDYTIPVWEPRGPCRVEVTMRIHLHADITLAPGQGFSMGHSLHVRRPGMRIGMAPGAGVPVDTFLEPVDDLQLRIGKKEWDNADMVRFLAQPLTGYELEIPPGAAAGTRGEALGCFLLENRSIPGTLCMRGWVRGEDAFALSFELVPLRRELRAGETLLLEYTLHTVIEDEP
ncbi:MAG: hypothetical protein HQ523_12085 [Lentisphaerae bacterium]|nr:hypothetical protein [Lentisphaerota bacterium]